MSLIATAPPELERASGLLVQLGDALEAGSISYCRWKGHRRPYRPGGDVDLLVADADVAATLPRLQALGFKRVVPAVDAGPGDLHFLGLDPASGDLVHAHVQTAVLVGPPWRTRYRLPVDAALRASAVRRGALRVPAPDLELIVLVLRLVLSATRGDLLRRGEPWWLETRRDELAAVERDTTAEAALRAARELLAEVDPALFAACRDVLRPGTRARYRWRVRQRLAGRLATYAVRPQRGARRQALWLRARALLRRPGPAMHLDDGGAVIALAGADGAGQSTCARALLSWLAPLSSRHAHLGRPSRSLATLVTGGVLKVSHRLAQLVRLGVTRQLAAHAELVRALATARDRARIVTQVRRWAASGSLVICERYPVPEDWALVGPSRAQGMALAARGPLAAWLRGREEERYRRIPRPDVLCTLAIEPDEAARRKTTEPAPYVRRRARESLRADWANAGARIIDAGRPLSDVLRALKLAVWTGL